MPDTPKHSVSVAGVVMRNDGLILVVQRRDNARWEPPGGVLETGETLEDGVHREVFEETGVEVEVGRLTGVYKNIPQAIIALVFRCHPVSGLATATDESQRVQWLTMEEISDRMTPAYAVRIADALKEDVAVRAHDGENIISS